MMILVIGSAMENSVRLMGTLGGPPQVLSSSGGDDTNTREPKVDALLGALVRQDQPEATTGISCDEVLVRSLEGWEGGRGHGTLPRQRRGNRDQLEEQGRHIEHHHGWR